MYEFLFDDKQLYKKLLAKELVEIITKADKAYHNDGKAIITDDYYDLLIERLKERAPKNPYFKKIGFKPSEKTKIKLPYYLGSQNKFKFEDSKEINKWFSKYKSPTEYYLNEKLDGISCLITSDNDKNIKIYTRGDGYNGLDITYIKTYIKNIPTDLPKNFAVRGELLLSKKNWISIKDEGANPRNVVAGVINSKTINLKILNLIEFIAYDYLSDRLPINDSMLYLESIGFKIAKYKLINHTLNTDELFEYLKEFKKNSEYEIDGIIITHNKSHNLDIGKNPDYAFAFKSNIILDSVEVIVLDVEWNISKDKYLKPIVKFNPIIINGVSIKQATGFNADFIVKHKIGKGSVIKIQRSGDVIPHITEILKESDDNLPLMPKIPYIWNKTKIDILIEGDDKNRDHDIKSFTFFMKSLNIKGISEGIITKLYDNSYDTLYKIINISKEQILEIDGFKDKSALNLITSLNEIKLKSCKEIMIASNILGRGIGEKKLELIFKEYPFICIDKNKALELKIDDIKKINGMGDITSKQFIDNLNKFFEFYQELEFKEIEKSKSKSPPKIINKKIENKHFVFSGFRNKEFEDYIKENNGIIDNNIIKNTNYLIIKDNTKITTKIKIAEEKGLIIILSKDFLNFIKNDL